MTQPEGDALPVRLKAIYAPGDHTVNLGLSAMLFLFPVFLTDTALLRPALAGLVPLVARWIDAFADPAMGRLSDATRWQAVRRRPFFLLGAIPLGISFAAALDDDRAGGPVREVRLLLRHLRGVRALGR